MHLSVLDLLWGQELKKGTGSEFTDSTAFSLEGLVLRALHDRLQESHTNHTMMWDDKRCILALGRNKQSLKTNSTAPPSQTWLQSSQRTSRNLPAPCHHLWSGWLPVWPTQHDDGAGDTQIIKKNRLGSTQKNQLHAKARAAVQRNLTPEERNLACEDSKSTPVNTIQWCLATKVSQAKTKVSQKRLRTWSRFRLRPFRPVSVIESNREAKLSLTVILGKL